MACDFKDKFGGVKKLQRQRLCVGGCGFLQNGERFIYYLTTKMHHSNKPSMQTMQSSLYAMKKLIKQHGVTHLGMPFIGCGLDRLPWSAVKKLVAEVFADVEIIIAVRWIHSAQVEYSCALPVVPATSESENGLVNLVPLVGSPWPAWAFPMIRVSS